jgi:phage terminase large subunit-like protein
MVTTLLLNERPRGEFLLIAPTVSLAHIAFNQALGTIDKDPDGFLPVTIKRLEEDWEKARLKRPGRNCSVASQHLNLEIGLALRSDCWVGADYWAGVRLRVRHPGQSLMAWAVSNAPVEPRRNAIAITKQASSSSSQRF